MAQGLVSIGEAFEDVIFHGLPRLPRPGEELRTTGFHRTFGGGTLITAVAAARLGTPVTVVSALSAEAEQRLATEQVASINLRKPREPHAVSVALSTRRDRAFVTFDGANAMLQARLLARFSTRLPRAAHVHVALGPEDPGAWVPLLQRMRARGLTTSWDFGWHDDLPRRTGFAHLLRQIDWVFLNEREALHYAGTTQWARALSRWPTLAPHVVIKRGARGAVLLADGAELRVPAVPVTVVDTTGAGDAFNGGFLAARLAGRPLDQCMRWGVLTGSLSTAQAGGLDGLPTANVLRQELARHEAPRKERKA